jgi:hypothetical protein
MAGFITRIPIYGINGYGVDGRVKLFSDLFILMLRLQLDFWIYISCSYSIYHINGRSAGGHCLYEEIMEYS